MKMLRTVICGALLSGLMIATVSAGNNEGSSSLPASGQQETKKSPASRREQQGRAEVQRAKISREQVKSRESGTAGKKNGLSRRNKATIEQTRQSEMRRQTIRSDASGTTTK